VVLPQHARGFLTPAQRTVSELTDSLTIDAKIDDGRERRDAA
jgi:hypothetical protein